MNLHRLVSDTTVSNAARHALLQGSEFMEGALKQRTLRVYLVEDSPHVRELLLDFLHVPGEVEIVGFADNESDAVAAMLAQPVDVAIVDLKLREGGGMAVIERLRKSNLFPQPKIIVFTNHPFPEIRKRAMQLGADYFFDKSADYDSVRTTLQALRTA
jgi:DNA-binding NarL/FixJ family response regulator